VNKLLVRAQYEKENGDKSVINGTEWKVKKSYLNLESKAKVIILHSVMSQYSTYMHSIYEGIGS